MNTGKRERMVRRKVAESYQSVLALSKINTFSTFSNRKKQKIIKTHGFACF